MRGRRPARTRSPLLSLEYVDLVADAIRRGLMPSMYPRKAQLARVLEAVGVAPADVPAVATRPTPDGRR